MEKINKVIFIDDDIPTTEYHRHIVEKLNFASEALFFTDAEEALKYMQSIADKYDFPDLVFVDINMPKMNGHEFVSAVVDIPSFNQNRTIIAHLTTSATLRDQEAARENEVERYYYKPLTGQTISEILKKDFNIDFPVS
jgi:CheY-like chemotaxis protein